MKKMLMFIAAIACAVGLQAATVQWGGAIQNADGSDTLPAGTKAYLLWSDSAISQPAKFDGTTGVVSTYTLTADDSMNWVFSADYTKAGDVNGFYAVLVQSGDYYSFYNAGQVTGTTAASAPTDLKLNADWQGTATLTSGGFVVAHQSGGVPEPTSGLLLLIGGAMLALRRKQK